MLHKKGENPLSNLNRTEVKIQQDIITYTLRLFPERRKNQLRNHSPEKRENTSLRYQDNMNT